MSNNIKTIYFCPKDNPAKTRLNLDPIYLSCLSQMSLSVLRNIARESKLKKWTALKKADLITFLKKNSFTIMGSLHKQTLSPDTLRAWVELFAPDISVSEHYTSIILSTLAQTGYFRTKRHRKKIIRFPLSSFETLDIDDVFTYNAITNLYNDSDSESEY